MRGGTLVAVYDNNGINGSQKQTEQYVYSNGKLGT